MHVASHQGAGSASSQPFSHDTALPKGLQHLLKPQADEQLETPQAITATDDVVDVGAMAKSVADMQALIKRLTEATGAGDVADALEAVQSFVNDSTNADMIGGAIGELAEMADTIMNAIKMDPMAFERDFSFAFQGSFQHSLVDNASSYREATSLNVSFSFSMGDTMMQGAMEFSESFAANASGFKYMKSEAVSLQVVSYADNWADNPMIQAFGELTQRLTGVDLLAEFKEAQQAIEEAVKQPVAGGYRALSVSEMLQVQFAHLKGALDSSGQLLEMLRDLAGGASPLDESSTTADSI